MAAWTVVKLHPVAHTVIVCPGGEAWETAAPPKAAITASALPQILVTFTISR
jgi:hypothetical protein